MVLAPLGAALCSQGRKPLVLGKNEPSPSGAIPHINVVLRCRSAGAYCAFLCTPGADAPGYPVTSLRDWEGMPSMFRVGWD